MNEQLSLKYLGLGITLSFFLAIAVETQAAPSEKKETLATTTKETETFVSEKMKTYSTNAADLIAQESSPSLINENAIVQVTGVRLNETPNGLQVILETAAGERLQPLIFPDNKTLIIDILDAVLTLPEGEEFRETNPAAGISEVTVTTLDATSIRITITGEKVVPTAEVVPSRQNLVLSVEPSTEAQETPQADEEIEVIATGEGQDSYFVPDATTATKTDTPIRDIPASIQVIPEQLLEDQGAVRLEEALRNISSVNFATAFGGREESFVIRGFEAETFKNNFFDDFFANRGRREIANIDHIEVLKGPASVLYGRAQPGGTINLVTKKPLFEPYYNVDFTVGSYDFYRPTLDFSGPLNPGKTVAYRLNLAYQNAGSFRDFVEMERVLVAPVLTWDVSPKTRLTFEGEYYYAVQPIDRGLVASGDGVADIPINRFLGDASNRNEFDLKYGYIFLDHQFSDNLSIRTAFRVTSSREIYDSVEAAGELEEDGRTLPLGAYFGGQYYETYTLQNDLIGKFKTGSVSHTLLFGFELAKGTAVYYDNKFGDAGTIDIFDPIYDFDFIYEDDSTFDGNVESYTVAFYLQDQITLLDNLKLLIGGRFDSFDSEEQYADSSFDTDSEASKFSPRVGILYQPIEPISLYANFSQSFSPQSGRTESGDPLKPERGTQYEVGIKTDLLDNRLFATLAAYQITKSNILTEDPNDPRLSIQVGKQRSRGIELDVVGEILPGWNVIASYGYTDAQITEDNTYEVGNRLNNVPYNTASLWTKYTIQTGSLAGLGFGAGVFYVDSRQGDLENSFEVDSYTRFDAAVSYTRDNFRAALNFKNLFDVEYFEGTQFRDSVIPGAPFTVLGTLSLKF